MNIYLRHLFCLMVAYGTACVSTPLQAQTALHPKEEKREVAQQSKELVGKVRELGTRLMSPLKEIYSHEQPSSVSDESSDDGERQVAASQPVQEPAQEYDRTDDGLEQDIAALEQDAKNLRR